MTYLITDEYLIFGFLHGNLLHIIRLGSTYESVFGTGKDKFFQFAKMNSVTSIKSVFLRRYGKDPFVT